MATITVTEFATELDTDARTARKFLRSVTPADAQPGKGSRWEIEKRDIRSLKSKFAKFTAANDQAKLDRELAKRESTAEVAAEAPEAGNDDEPTIDDLLAIDEMIDDLDD